MAPKGCGGLAMGASGGGVLIRLGAVVDIIVEGGGVVGAAVDIVGLLGQRFAGGCAAKT